MTRSSARFTRTGPERRGAFVPATCRTARAEPATRRREPKHRTPSPGGRGVRAGGTGVTGLLLRGWIPSDPRPSRCEAPGPGESARLESRRPRSEPGARLRRNENLHGSGCRGLRGGRCCPRSRRPRVTCAGRVCGRAPGAHTSQHTSGAARRRRPGGSPARSSVPRSVRSRSSSRVEGGPVGNPVTGSARVPPPLPRSPRTIRAPAAPRSPPDACPTAARGRRDGSRGLSIPAPACGRRTSV